MKIDYTQHVNSQQLHSINCKGQLLNLSNPLIMGILNVTPDSFFDGGKFTEQKAIISRVTKMRAEGVHIIDLGGQSTRPKAKMVSEKTELNRLLPAVDAILQKFPDSIISIDTFRSNVALKCLETGAAIINDVSAGNLDKEMFNLVAEKNIPYVMMHMQGTPENMQTDPEYKNVLNEILSELGEKVSALRGMGVNDIIVDPGFGFGKTVDHNYSLLNGLSIFKSLHCPVLVGISRKSMICKVLGIKPDQALNGTTALHMTALMNGASILRVHDVVEAKQVVTLFEKYVSS